MYTDNFEEEILFIPARKDKHVIISLKIVTAFTDVERISSHLINYLMAGIKNMCLE